FRRIRRPDTRCHHDAGEQGPKLAGKSNSNETGNQPLRSEALQLVAGQQGHGEAEEKRNQPNEKHRNDTGTLRMAKKTDVTNRNADMLNPLDTLYDRVHNQPEHAAYFAKKIARDMADSFGNYNGRWFGGRHGREVASLLQWEKSKVLRR